MYRLLLVDDEPIILEGLQRIIPWNDLGFQLIGSASNGKEALELALTKAPDLIITDVRMKFLDGITLIKTVLQKNKQTLCVVISAYDEFSYARDACNLGAFSYILKPLIRDELLEVVIKVKQVLDDRNGNVAVQSDHEVNQLGSKETFSKIVFDAIGYIEEYSSNSELSLHQLSERYQVNPIYLGQLLKKESGRTFSEHVNDIRIRKAKSLLDYSQAKVYEIAELTGFSNAYYFNIVFKKITGLTPLEYRNQDKRKGL